MLSRSEQADIPDLDAQQGQLQQARIAALGITISQFQKTLQGHAIIERQELFCLNARLYQGYNQKAVEVPEDQCTDPEFKAIHDVDGSLGRLMDTRRRRLEGNANAKSREQAERNQKKIAAERDELELKMLRRRVMEQEEKDEAAKPAVETPKYGCAHPGCGKTFSTSEQLQGHKMGARH